MKDKELDNNKILDEEQLVEKIIKDKKIKEGTIFTKRYNAYNCFSHLIGKTYDKNSKFWTRGGVMLCKFNKRLEKENILEHSNKFKNWKYRENIAVLSIIRFSEHLESEYKNYLSADNKMWHVEVSKETAEAGYFYTDFRYTFLFVRERNSCEEEQYEFLGLYKFVGYDEKNYIRRWEKCTFSNNEVPTNEEEIIEVIKKIEKE